MKLIINENIDNLIDVHEIIECTKYLDDSAFPETQTLEDDIIEDTSTYAEMQDYRDYIIHNDPMLLKAFYNEFINGVDYLFTITRTNVNDSSDVYKLDFFISVLFAEDYAKLSPED